MNWDDFEAIGTAAQPSAPTGWDAFEPIDDPIELKNAVFKEYAKKDLLEAEHPLGQGGGIWQQAGNALLNPALPGSGIRGSIRSSGAQIGERFAGLVNRTIGRWGAADDNHRWAQAYEQAASELTATPLKKAGSIGRNVITSILPSAATARATKTAIAPIALGTATEASEALQEARDAGLPMGESLTHAAKQAAYEALPAILFQRLNKLIPGLGGTESALVGQAGKATAKQLLIGTGAEIAEEGITTVGQTAESEAAGVNPGAFTERLGESLVDTALVAAISNNVANAPAIIEKVAALAQKNRPTRSEWLASGLPITREIGSTASDRAAFVEELRQTAAADPAQFPSEPLPPQPEGELERVSPPISGGVVQKFWRAELPGGKPFDPSVIHTGNYWFDDEAAATDWAKKNLPGAKIYEVGLTLDEMRGVAEDANMPGRGAFILPPAARQKMREVGDPASPKAAQQAEAFRKSNEARQAPVTAEDAAEMVPPPHTESIEAFDQPERLVAPEPLPPDPAQSIRELMQQGPVSVSAQGWKMLVNKVNDDGTLTTKQGRKLPLDKIASGEYRVELEKRAPKRNGRLTPKEAAIADTIPEEQLRTAAEVTQEIPSAEPEPVREVLPPVAEAAPPAIPAEEVVQEAKDDFKEFAATHKYTAGKRNGKTVAVVTGPNGFEYYPKANEKNAAKREAYEWLKGLMPHSEWRKWVDDTDDPSRKGDILRRIADKSKSDAELQEVMGRAPGLPETGNILWAVHRNPNASEETKAQAKAAYDAHWDQLAGDEPDTEAAPEAEQPAPPFRITAKKKNGTKGVNRQSIISAFPGARVESIPNGWRAHVGQSYVDIENVQKIDIDWDAVERTMGSPVPKQIRDDTVAAGQYVVTLPDGTKHDGLGIIRLVEGQADDDTVRHEALHLARKAGLLTDAEWQSLVSKYGDPKALDGMNEEAIAKSREAVVRETNVWEKIKSWLRRILSAIGVTEVQARDVWQKMDEAGFWQRRAVPAKSDAAYALEMRQRWHSKAKQTIEEKMGGKATPQAVMSLLKNNGVKEEEIEWTGLKELLGGTALKSVTKEQVLASIDGGVKIEEVVKGGEFPGLTWTQDSPRDWDAKGSDLRIELMPNGKYRLESKYSGMSAIHPTLEAAKEHGNTWAGNSFRSDDKYSQYQTPGGENYRELLLTLPDDGGRTPISLDWEQQTEHLISAKLPSGNLVTIVTDDRGQESELQVLTPDAVDVGEPKQFSTLGEAKAAAAKMAVQKKQDRGGYRTRHFDEPNILAHVRFNERTDADGKRVLFIEEVQSDWHQEGKKKGYRQKDDAALRPVREGSRWVIHDDTGNDAFPGATYGTREQAEYDIQHAMQGQRWRGGGVPDAPFKKTWPALAMKRMIQWASENGFDRVAWTTGDMQNERYDLSKQIRDIVYVPFSDGTFAVSIGNKMLGNDDLDLSQVGERLPNKDAGRTWYAIPGEKLEDLVGKEVAQKMHGREGMQNPHKWDRNPDGENLRVLSGDGLRIGGSGMKGFYDNILPSETNKLIKKFGAKVEKTGIDIPAGYGESGDPHGPTLQPARGEMVHSFDITPQMRESAVRGGQPMYQLRARPDLANPVDAPTGSKERELVDVVDADRNARGEPQVRHDVDVQAEAAARLQADYAGERKRLLEVAAKGGQLLDTDTVVAKAIVSREAVEAVKSGNVQDAIELIEAYRRTGTEQARGFRQRRDPVESPAERMRRMIVEAVLTPPQKTSEKIRHARESGDHDAANKLNAEWAKKFDDLKKQLLELGVDLDKLNEMGYEPITEAQALSTISAAKADVWDKVYEYWRNSILSSLKTQAANLSGNAGHAAWHFTAERLVEAMSNKAMGRTEGAQLAELKHMWAGFLPGLSQGARNWLLTFQTELPQFDRQLGREGQFRIESANVAIGGKLGRTVRLPQRLLLATDDLARTLFANMEVGAQAYRIAKSEGLEGAEMAERMRMLVADIDSDAWTSSYDIANELAFQQKGSPVSQKIKRNLLSARRDLPGLRYIIPFITTPMNILETGLRKTPLGTAPLAYKMYQNHRAGKPIMQDATGQAAQQMIAWAIALALLSNDEEDPWITGAAAEMSSKTRDLARRTHPPQSVKLFGKWRDYSRLEPFATSIGLMVDWVNAGKGIVKQPGRALQTPFTSIVGQLKDKTFLSGIGDLLKATEADSMVEGAGKWASNFAVSWVPNIARTAGRSLDDEQQQRGIWGRGSDWWKMLAQRTVQKTEVPGVASQPMYDLWGRTIPTTKSPIPMTDWVYRMTVPGDSKLENIHPGDRLILNYNNQNPDDARYPGAMRKSYTHDDETIYMTDEQFADYSRISGRVASLIVEGDEWNFDKPTAEDMDRLEAAVIDGRSAARDALVASWHGGKPVDDSEKGIALLASTKFLRQLGTPFPQSVPKAEKEKGVKWADFSKEFKSDNAKAKAFLDKHGITRGEALSAFDAATSHLEASTRTRQRGVLLSRLSGPSPSAQ